MATITKLQRSSGVRFKAIIRKGGRVLKTKTFATKTAARTWARRIEGDDDLVRALGSPGASITLRQLCSEYMAQWRGKDTTRVQRVGFWADSMGATRLTDIIPADIRVHLNDYGQGQALRGDGIGPDSKRTTKPLGRTRAPATVNRMKAALGAVLKYAMKRGYITRNPATMVSALSEDNKHIRWLSDDERKRLLAACEASAWPKLTLLVVLAMTTGARLGELHKLRWSDVSFAERTALLTDTKNGEDRVLMLPEVAISVLTQHREIGSGLVFAGTKHPDRPREFRKHWNAALEQAGITRLRFHDLRHDFCSQMAMHGASLVEIAELAGHKDLSTTKRYAHLSTAHKRALSDRVVGEVFGRLESGAQS